jgi:hypothetical protein
MDPAADGNGQTLAVVRQIILAVLLLGMIGALTELVLLAHYEDAAQLIPLALLVLALLVLTWQLSFPSPWSVRTFQATMLLFVAAGFAGIVFHYQGSQEFQLETDPYLSGMSLFWKVVQAKAPPTLAPALMVQLGVLGLAYVFTRRARY